MKRDLRLSLQGKRVLVVGLGVHGGGLGVTKWLVAQGAEVTVTDLKTADELAPSLAALAGLPVRYVLGQHRVEDLDGADLVIRNPAVPAESAYLAEARARGIPIAMEMDLFFQLCPAPIIGITGTKGKTTTTLLIGSILRQTADQVVVAGNLRISALEMLPTITADTPTVIELSSWQLEGLDAYRLSPHVGVVTNVSADHLNRYPSFAAYAQTKAAIVRWQSPNDVAVLNRDNGVVAGFVGEGRGKVIWFSRRQPVDGVYVDGDHVIRDWQGRREVLCHRQDIRLPGMHNLENVLAASAAAVAWAASTEAIRKGVQSFAGVEHRLEFVRETGGVRAYNDSAATAPAATVAALASFDRPIVLLVGGADKNLDFVDLGRAIATTVKAVVLLEGTATNKLEGAIRQAGGQQIVGHYDNIEAAVRRAFEVAQSGDVVLLSPGCASFGMFANEFERGERFKQAVQKVV